jgi:LDH2 family malate/lactate/ureidoglycolate dehydrogenase
MSVTVEIPRLRSLIVARLAQVFGPGPAEQMADVVLFGELAGRTTHGIIRLLPGRKGPVDEAPGHEPLISRSAPAAAAVEGRPGMLVASIATDLVIEIASEHGFAVVTTVGSSSSSGSLTFYVERLTAAGLVAFVSGNTLSFAAPSGGRSRILGTNPFSIGIPAGRYPFITDIGTSAITYGDVVEARAAGIEIPPDVAVDAEGRPTRRPEDVLDGGALLTFGGHKGLGLAMAVELMAGALAGSAAAPVGPDDVWGHVFVAFSLEMLGDPGRIRRDAEAILERLRNAPTAVGSEIRIPGQRSLANRDAALQRGRVDVDSDSLAELLALVGEAL